MNVRSAILGLFKTKKVPHHARHVDLEHLRLVVEQFVVFLARKEGIVTTLRVVREASNHVHLERTMIKWVKAMIARVWLVHRAHRAFLREQPVGYLVVLVSQGPSHQKVDKLNAKYVVREHSSPGLDKQIVYHVQLELSVLRLDQPVGSLVVLVSQGHTMIKQGNHLVMLARWVHIRIKKCKILASSAKPGHMEIGRV